jgi:flagella basal body P-ring formation protein FlgA
MKSWLALVMFASARLAAAEGTPCFTVDGDQISAGEFAVAFPSFAALPPRTSVVPAPIPGVRRFFKPFELESISRRFGLELDPNVNVCFEHPMESLDPGRVLDAMRAALDVPGAKIELTEISSFPVPRGVVEFRRETLRRPGAAAPGTPIEWRGSVRYAKDRLFPIWARAVITAPVPRVVAAEPLKAGESIALEQLRVEAADLFPLTGDLPDELAQVAGRIPIRSIAAGEEIHLKQLKTAPDVNRGDSIEIEVHSGGARLAFTATAETGGNRGDLISVRNPANKSLFRARVNGKHRASVDVSPTR